MHRQTGFCKGGWNNSPLLSPLLCPSCWKDCEGDTPCFALRLTVKCASLSDAWRNFLSVVYIVQISGHHSVQRFWIQKYTKYNFTLNLPTIARCESDNILYPGCNTTIHFNQNQFLCTDSSVPVLGNVKFPAGRWDLYFDGWCCI